MKTQCYNGGILNKTAIRHVIYDANEVLPAMAEARPKERVIYYEGYLPIIRQFNNLTVDPWQLSAINLSDQIKTMCYQGDLHMFQLKRGDFDYLYIAQKASPSWKGSREFKDWVMCMERNRDKTYNPAKFIRNLTADEKISNFMARLTGNEARA